MKSSQKKFRDCHYMVQSQQEQDRYGNFNMLPNCRWNAVDSEIWIMWMLFIQNTNVPILLRGNIGCIQLWYFFLMSAGPGSIKVANMIWKSNVWISFVTFLIQTPSNQIGQIEALWKWLLSIFLHFKFHPGPVSIHTHTCVHTRGENEFWIICV